MVLSSAVKSQSKFDDDPFSHTPKVELVDASDLMRDTPFTLMSFTPAPKLLSAVTWSKVEPTAPGFTLIPARLFASAVTLTKMAAGPFATTPLPFKETMLVT